MNELHRVFVKSACIDGKDINLTIEEEHSPENPGR